MRVSPEQHKVLSAMRPGVQYGARDLKCRTTTLNSLVFMGLVAESIPHQLWAFFTSAPYRRRFKITEEGVATMLARAKAATALVHQAQDAIKDEALQAAQFCNDVEEGTV